MTDSLRIARTFPVQRERVYRAWTDAAEMARWYSPADGMTLSIDALDVRAGGRYQATFGRPGEVPFVESGEYRRVVPGRLLAFDMTIARGGRILSRTRCTVELVEAGEGTQLVLTDEGEGAGEHGTGWAPALDHLAELFRARRFVLLMLDGGAAPTWPADEERRAYDRMMAFAAELEARGMMEGGEPLATHAEGVRVQVRDGRAVVTDGPFPASPELLGGYTIIRCGSREEAIAIASRCPAAEWGTVEVREIRAGPAS